MKADTILATIGNTPHIRIQRLFGNLAKPGQQVWIKSERANPGGSSRTASPSRWSKTPRSPAR